MNNSSSNALSVTYHQLVVTPAWILFVSGGFLGFVANSSVILVQKKQKSLRNFHVCSLACFDALCCINYVILPYFVASPEGIPKNQCMYTMLLLIFFLSTGSILTLTAGIDRLLMITTVSSYDVIGCRFRKATVSVLLTYPTLVVTMGLFYATEEALPLCMPPSALFGSPAFSVWNLSTLSINILVVIIYGVLAVLLRRNKPPAQHSTRRHTRNRQMIGSAIVVAVMHISTWTCTMIILLLSARFVTSEVALLHAQLYAGVFATANNASNGFIYFARCKQYRQTVFRVLGIAKEQSGSVGSTSVRQRMFRKMKRLSANEPIRFESNDVWL